MAYRSAASCEPTKAKLYQEPLEIAVLRCDDMMKRIIHETSVESYKVFISGPDNFRYAIDPMYKFNRTDVVRPEWLQPIRERLVVEWGAHVSDGIEADDDLGIGQTDSTIICSLDKDLLQVPGRHYNWVKQEWSTIDERTGWINFYTQLIMGDRADNIPGYDGKMRAVCPQFLQPTMDELGGCEDELDMYNVVADLYLDHSGMERMHINGELLYIQRCEGDKWHVPT